MNDQELREHCIEKHDLRRKSRLSGKNLKAWHEKDHTVVDDHKHPEILVAVWSRWKRNDGRFDVVRGHEWKDGVLYVDYLTFDTVPGSTTGSGVARYDSFMESRELDGHLK